jgi:hypothetical protein
MTGRPNLLGQIIDRPRDDRLDACMRRSAQQLITLAVRAPTSHVSLRSWPCDLMSSTTTHVRPPMVSFGFRWRG